MRPEVPFEYAGPAALEAGVVEALHRVADPEMALDIVELGLVYGVRVEGAAARVALTMTSAACPVADLIVGEVVDQLTLLLGPRARVECELVWDPPWGPQRMSPRARRTMGWD